MSQANRPVWRIVVRGVVAVALLVPLTLLVVQARKPASDVLTTTDHEHAGIAYLRALQPVLITFVANETLAVSRKHVDPTAIESQMAAVTLTDKRYGGVLGTTVRWNGFLSAVHQLETLGQQTPLQAYNSYTAVSDLLLDVYERVRDRSGLVQDQQPDIFFLEDCAVRALPASVVGAGRYGDSVIVQANSTGADAQTAALNVSTYRTLLDEEADEVEDDVHDAVDATSSTDLSSNLLSAINTYNVSVEALEPKQPASATAGDPGPTAGTPPDQSAEERDAAALSDALYDQITLLVDARAAHARDQGSADTAYLVIAIVLLLGLILLDVGGRRQRRITSPSAPGASGTGGATATGIGGAHRNADTTPQRERAGAAR